MKDITEEKYHKLYGVKNVRITYKKSDFLDYVIMAVLTGAILYFTYGMHNPLAQVGMLLCAAAVAFFPLRHGIEFKVPIILSRPQEILYMFVHKVQNLRAPYYLAILVLIIENVVIYFTPEWPHKTALMGKIALYAFYGHIGLLTLYRTVIFVAHLIKREQVKEILMQSAWKGQLKRQPNITLEIFHAYFTGLLTHIVYVAPWYLVITYLQFSLVLLPVTCIAAFVIQTQFVKQINAWFYRDHWLGHNSELEFVYLHGPHHDAIPSGMIAVAGNGYLEGYVRGLLGFPIPFYNPIMAVLFYTIDVKIDIDSHQYIPGVFPGVDKDIHMVTQHSTHHYGRVEPLGFAINFDQPNVPEKAKKLFKLFPDELNNSIKIDEKLNGYQWDNHRYRWFLSMIDKYENNQKPDLDTADVNAQ
ncbi:hypothetical protein [Teredinibacter sp. KSP-S5-2]|uniref:hypothetical protein n=1 Tax=Teredinibacter sp. KSP-S5-2 TaxID=3034506 RepID=UPI00293459ED|nr:hypothetical protein [Teredinibacter sp. KSP-S5-2]WNO11558.1 hypothetical protein P5V12_10280 [Teredinibacter sp. KSP-S5-2]